MSKGKIEIPVVKSTEKKEWSSEGRKEVRKMFTSSWKISIIQCFIRSAASHTAMKPNMAALQNSLE
jgi:hypothetical protein